MLETSPEVLSALCFVSEIRQKQSLLKIDSEESILMHLDPQKQTSKRNHWRALKSLKGNSKEAKGLTTAGLVSVKH